MSSRFYNKYKPDQTYTIDGKTFTGKELDNFLATTGFDPKNLKKNKFT